MATVTVQNMSFKAGQTLTITGVPKADATSFAINIGSSPTETALHINPRFDAHGDSRTIVCNSYQGGSWCEELRGGSFPFNHGEEFKVQIRFTATEFEIILPDGSTINFPNRPGVEKYNFITFEGEARVNSFEIK